MNVLGLLKSNIEAVRHKAAQWAKSAPIEEVLKHVPGAVFGQTVGPTEVDQKQRAKRILTKIRARVSEVDAKRIRTELQGLKPKTEAYSEKRDSLSRSLGYTRRQVGAAATGIERAAKRKKAQPKKK
ncbi:MAG: hypothetical protein V4690_02955 [Patescibacteria group bacterium]